MCKWSIAIVKFNEIFKKVKPIQESQHRATEIVE